MKEEEGLSYEDGLLKEEEGLRDGGGLYLSRREGATTLCAKNI